MRRPPNRRCKK